MEARALYHTPAASGPRNLVRPIAQWLRELGFTALEAEHSTMATLEAHWDSPEGHRFYFYYEWSAMKALVSLTLTYPGEWQPLDLIKGQHVGRLREARRLLYNDARFRAVQQTAKGQSLPIATS